MGSFFDLISFNWTLSLDCFGCFDVFVFMVLFCQLMVRFTPVL